MRWIPCLLLLLAGCDPDDAGKRRAEAAELGVSWPEGTRGVGLLVDMLDDDDAQVRETAAKSLAALGRKGLADLSRFLNDRRDPARAVLLDMGERFAMLGAAVTPADLADPMAARRPVAARRAGAAGAVLAAWGDPGPETMIDILTATRKDANEGVRAMASASLAVLGWTAVAAAHPASADEVKDLVPLLGAEDDEPTWVSCIAAFTITALRPRATWPESVATSPYATTEWEGPRLPADAVDALDAELRALVETAQGDPDDWERRNRLGVALRKVRALKDTAEPLRRHLERLLEKERGQDRVDVARTLFAVAPKQAAATARALAATLGEGEAWPRAQALDALGAMGAAARPAIPALIEVLAWSEAEDGDARDPAGQCSELGLQFQFALRSKRAAATMLGHLGAKEAVPALTKLTSHADARLRYRAQTALRRIG